MTHLQAPRPSEVKAKAIAQLLYPGQSLSALEVADTVEFLEECIRYNTIISMRKFLRIFHTIPKQSIDTALRSGTTVVQLIQDSAELQRSLMVRREIRAESRTVNRVNPAEGGKHRRGSRVS